MAVSAGRNNRTVLEQRPLSGLGKNIFCFHAFLKSSSTLAFVHFLTSANYWHSLEIVLLMPDMTVKAFL